MLSALRFRLVRPNPPAMSNTKNQKQLQTFRIPKGVVSFLPPVSHSLQSYGTSLSRVFLRVFFTRSLCALARSRHLPPFEWPRCRHGVLGSSGSLGAGSPSLRLNPLADSHGVVEVRGKGEGMGEGEMWQVRRPKSAKRRETRKSNTTTPLLLFGSLHPWQAYYLFPKGLSCVPKEHAEGGSKLAGVSSKTVSFPPPFKHHPRRHKF